MEIEFLLASFIASILSTSVLSNDVCALDEVPYGVGSWPSEQLGNHRARIQVAEKADAVWVRIPWRRRDLHPEKKSIIIVDAASGEQIKNIVRVNINRGFGDLVFQPVTVPGKYFVYYMPYEYVGSESFPNTVYKKTIDMADSRWLRRCGLTQPQLAQGKWRQFPQAKVIEIQAASEFKCFDPMEVVATAREVEQLLVRNPNQSYLLFPDDRRFPIRMTDDLPLRWIKAGPSNEFHGKARPGEFYTFQVGVYAARDAITDINVTYTDMKNADRKTIPASEFRCFNLSGTDWLGREFSKVVSVQKGKVQALWFGVQIPKDIVAGEYLGALTLQPKGGKATKVKLLLDVSGEVLPCAGDSELWRHSRLRWLDSTIGLDDEVFEPYTPIEVKDDTVGILGRKMRYDRIGLPASIVSTFTDTVDSGGEKQRAVLARPMSMVVETEDGTVSWTGGKPRIVGHKSGTVVLQSDSIGGAFSLQCRAKIECDGYINYWLKVKVNRDIDVKDMRLEIPYQSKVAKYMMGLGRKGGYRPKEWKWKWNIEFSNGIFWLGDVNAGLQCRLKGHKDTWELFNYKESGIPEDWYNEGKGGCTISEESEDVLLVQAYSGPRSVKKGEELLFRFGLLITPVKVLDKEHWDWRYWHHYSPVDEVAKAGANIINIHHANELNPFINYPFIAVDKLKAYIDEAHKKGIKVKLYYTVRELTNHAAELWALRSLGDEIYRLGEGFRLADTFASRAAHIGDVTTGNSWLCEHLITDYVPAWHHHFGNGIWDAAIAQKGLSRWHNYYLEGLAWLIKYLGVDGIYIDGLGYDREIMKRVRKVMDRGAARNLIDFHCGNHFRPQYGLNNISNFFMEHFPFINSLWLGEGFNYNESPDYWLVELSGIPYGLFSEMLGKGNPWRGMVYGMTNRLPYGGGDPRGIWKLWDEFGIKEAKMIGYWSKNCPVKTNHKDVLATAYVKQGKTLVSLASWAKEQVGCQLKVDWEALGINQSKASLYAPPVEGFQEERLFKPGENISVPQGRGWLLLLDDFEIGKLDGSDADLQVAKQLKDDGRYQNGGYWATPLPWFMDTLMRVDPVKAAQTFCDAVADFQASGINEWINDKAAGVKDYNASAAMPLAGVRRLRAFLAAHEQKLPTDLDRQVTEARGWLEKQADRIIRDSSRIGKKGVRIFTPDATGGYGAFWVRDWSYSIEGRPEAFTREEIRDGYLFLAFAQREDGCMPDRVKPDGIAVYSPGPEQNQLSKSGSTDQSPFMVIICHQYWKLHDDLSPFIQTVEALEKAMCFTPRNPDNGLVTITSSTLFRPYSFMDTVPLVGDEQFSSVLFWDACLKLAEMFEAKGDTQKAETWCQKAKHVQTELRNLWNDELGVFVAASEKWPQPSVWGSVFAVYAGISTPEQTKRIANFCVENYDRIIKRGQLRHLLKGTFWGQTEAQYVNG